MTALAVVIGLALVVLGLSYVISELQRDERRPDEAASNARTRHTRRAR